MIYYVDIDDTICKTPDIGIRKNYFIAEPYKDRIEKINKLYDEGHKIHYWTSRGMMTGLDWQELTEKQLELWGCKYTSLNMKKPMYDYWIDDKAFNSEDFFT